MKSPTLMVDHQPGTRIGTKVPTSRTESAEKDVRRVLQSDSQASAGLHLCIRPLASLSRQEIADLARHAADNSEPLHAANPFERDTQRFAWFTRAWLERLRELAPHTA